MAAMSLSSFIKGLSTHIGRCASCAAFIGCIRSFSVAHTIIVSIATAVFIMTNWTMNLQKLTIYLVTMKRQSAWLTSIQLAGVTPEVNLRITHVRKHLYTVSRCCTRGESEDHTSKKACKGFTLALKPRADVTRSPKQGYQWLAPRKGLMSSKFFIKTFTWS